MNEDIANIRARGKYNSRLEEHVAFWPTPNAGDYKAGMSKSPTRQQYSLGKSVAIVENTTQKESGGLNPTWVEWLMGFPIGHTDLNN